MFYGFLSTVIFVLILPFWIIAGVLKPKLIVGFKEKLGGKYIFKSSRKGKTLVFYGVSVGEIVAMQNLIKKTRETFSDINIVVLTGTQTGQEIAKKNLSSVADLITYFPFDVPFCINNFIKKIQPDAVFVMETELWPNFARIMEKNHVHLYIINGRISDRTYKSYKKLSFFFGPILKKYTNIFTQSAQDNQKFTSLGASSCKTKIMGNLKFDIQAPDVSDLNFNKNSSHKILLAGSTHDGEEKIILDSFFELKKEIPEIKLIIAPRHLRQKYEIKNCGYRSKGDNLEDYDILLLDTMGELSKFYCICDVAFIGGSFALAKGDNKGGRGAGGHNPLEATIFNKPVLSGPSTHNFKDIYSLLTQTNAGKIVKTKEALTKELKTLLTDDDYYQKASTDCSYIFEQNKGALDFVLEVIKRYV